MYLLLTFKSIVEFIVNFLFNEATLTGFKNCMKFYEIIVIKLIRYVLFYYYSLFIYLLLLNYYSLNHKISLIFMVYLLLFYI